MGYSATPLSLDTRAGISETGGEKKEAHRHAGAKEMPLANSFSVDPLNPGGDASHYLVGWNTLIDSDGCCANWIRLVT